MTRSPELLALWNELNAVFDGSSIQSFNTNLATDAKTFISDRSQHHTIVATGADAIPLIQGIVTSDVFKLAEPGRGQRSCAVNVNGRLIGDFRFLHVPDLFIINAEHGPNPDALLAHFRANIIAEDAKFTDRSSGVCKIGFHGDAMLLTTLWTLEHDPNSLDLYDGTWGTGAHGEAIVQKVSDGVMPSWEVAVDASVAADVWRDAVARGAAPIGEETTETWRVVDGDPRWGKELDTNIIPLEARLNDTIAYDKGCYLGQEVIARLDTKGKPAKLLRRILLPRFVEFNTISVDGKTVGEVKTQVHYDGEYYALGYIKRKFNAVDTVVEIDGIRGTIID